MQMQGNGAAAEPGARGEGGARPHLHGADRAVVRLLVQHRAVRRRHQHNRDHAAQRRRARAAAAAAALGGARLGGRGGARGLDGDEGDVWVCELELEGAVAEDLGGGAE
jgi:hypothetical protein